MGRLELGLNVMKLLPHEQLLVNVDAFLHKPPVTIGEDGLAYHNVHDDIWIYRATITLATGVKPTTLRAIKNYDAANSTTRPAFIGRFGLQSPYIRLDDKTESLIGQYHSYTDAIAAYVNENKLYRTIWTSLVVYGFDDPRFAEVIKKVDGERSRK